MMKKIRTALVLSVLLVAGCTCAQAQTTGYVGMVSPSASFYVTTVQPRYNDFPRYWVEGYARSSNHWVPYYPPSYTVAPSSRSPHYYETYRNTITARPYVIERNFNGYVRIR